jgi:hypothetical protein
MYTAILSRSVEGFVMRALALVLFASLWFASPLEAQSQAANGAIEGTVSDPSGGVLPGVTVTVTNTQTGVIRVLVTNESGLYRAPLLPLGTYRVSAELQGFKKFEQTGVTVSAGETAVIDIGLGVGEVTEVVSVTADSPLVNPAKINLGRNINEREVKSLPLVSRNPYNFALLQPGVTGYENAEFGVPRFNANGTVMRVNYQIDGNTNTQKDRAGLRLLPVSEVMVREVKVVTSGYAPEFGQTTGLVYNAITPSGTNDVRGSVSYRLRRKDFSARPFYFQPSPTIPDKPDTRVDTWTAEVGGPLVRDKVHYFVGFENTYRDLSADRAITISPAAAAQIGLAANEASGVMPAEQTARFLIGKVDGQLTASNRLTGRYIYFRNDSPNNTGNIGSGVPNSTQLATDFLDAMDSASTQLVSTLSSNMLNELRFQFARRDQSRTANDLSGEGPSVRIQGVANFGAPISGQQDAGFSFTQNIWQVVDNLTHVRGNHSYKYGVDLQVVQDDREFTRRQLFIFPNVDAYLAARSGANPRSYTTFQQDLGPTTFDMKSNLYSFFVQDDWRVTPSVKLLYGIRYDLYDVPEGNPDAPLESSREYSMDANNWGPRLGAAWTLNDQTVVRASTGIMYDQPILAIYESSIQQDGTRTVTVNLGPTSAGAPAFPNVLSGEVGVTLPTRSLFTVDPDFQVMRLWQNNIQVDRALGRDYSVQIGYVFTRGDNLPVVTNTNLINPIGTLADGRPIFSTAISAATRRDPRFNQINTVESIGESTYNALTLQLTKRFSRGYQFDLAYTLAEGEDNAPFGGATLVVQGEDGRSDPTDLDRDKGPNLFDQRHTFSGSIVMTPSVDPSSALAGLVNNNQLGVIVAVNSGFPVNLIANRDLNGDASAPLNDRPIGIGRNSLYLPSRSNVDFRYSRFIPIRGAMRAEIVVEAKNLFNTRATQNINRTIPVDVAGVPVAAVPSDADAFPIAGRSAFDGSQRQFQVGFKFNF